MFALAVVTASVAGCADNSTGTCAAPPSLGIRLTVRDARTGNTLDPVAVVEVVRLATPRDSLVGTTVDAVRITAGQPGTYRVTVDAPGFVRDTREVVVPAESGFCKDLITQNVTVTLRPAS